MGAAAVSEDLLAADLIDAFVQASKGSLVRVLLLALDSGYSFERVVGAMGDQGVAVALDCVCKGYIDRGKVTDEGRAFLARGAEA